MQILEIEVRVNQLLHVQERAIRVARSYYQHLDAYGLPPIELYKEFKTYKEAGVFCDFCTPSLIMIPSPACYEKDKDFWPNYFEVEHNVRSRRSIENPFEGVRGGYYPFQLIDRQHIDIVEMDDPSYFNSLSNEEKVDFARRFFNAMQINRLNKGSHVGFSVDIQDRVHTTLCQGAHVVFASRGYPDYDFKTDKIVKMDLPCYRIYQRSCL